MDLINAAARALIMYDVKEASLHAQRFATLIQAMSVQVNYILSALGRPKGITQYLVEIHRLENEADDFYGAAMRELFQERTQVIDVIKWKEVYEKLEAAMDRGEDIANLVESILIKNV